jgi:outer membrane lipoprotein carrier protein
MCVRIRFYVLLLCGLAAFGNIFANEMVEEHAAAELTTLLSGLKSLRADFSQQITDDDGELLQRTGGNALVKRPGHLRWETTAPYQHLVVANGEVLWRYDADLEQAVREPFDDRLSHTPSLLLSGEVSSLSETYRVEKNNGEGEKVFSLYPLDAESLFDLLIIRFDNGIITGMEIVDGFGQTTRLRFSNIEINPPLDNTLFEFTPPADADVIIDEQ